MRFEQALLDRIEEQFTPDLQQFFGNGVYMRQVFLPAGSMAAGRIHKRPCWNVLLLGEIEVATEDGVRLMVAPSVFESPAGIKRAVRAISDTIWLTVHAYDGEERDGDTMADLLTVPSYELLESHSPQDLLKE